MSREIREFGVPTLLELWKATSLAALLRVAGGPRAVEEPVHVRNLHTREPGDPMLALWLITSRAAQGTSRWYA
jgi:hypothetical protein